MTIQQPQTEAMEEEQLSYVDRLARLSFGEASRASYKQMGLHRVKFVETPTPAISIRESAHFFWIAIEPFTDLCRSRNWRPPIYTPWVAHRTFENFRCMCTVSINAEMHFRNSWHSEEYRATWHAGDEVPDTKAEALEDVAKVAFEWYTLNTDVPSFNTMALVPPEREKRAQEDTKYSQTYDDTQSCRISHGSSRATFATAKSRVSYASSGLQGLSRNREQSPWIKHLDDRGLIPDPFDEMNWSGRGQHAEFGEAEDDQIANLLIPEKIIGHSQTAVVESVVCRKIRLARKTINCIGKMKREDAIKEVEHLQKLQHSHIIRVVGSYVQKKTLSILLYPVASYNLESFLEFADELENKTERNSSFTNLCYFFGCLSNAMDHIHQQFTKHMDIKPKNILVQHQQIPFGRSKVYFADFGISRAYKSVAEAETDSPTPYTRMYAAPEVVDQDTRGFSADIFSLGCVFAEILAVLNFQRQSLIDVRARNTDGDTSYQANISPIADWLRSVPLVDVRSLNLDHYKSNIITMMSFDPSSRPSSDDIMARFGGYVCCNEGPEPFVRVAEPT
ncbi:kinase-like protein [Lophium mytilinum]|uniref:non-specific serine/threonine protein kinase n=1 Tax=Lophium mytilinum TaxID=390894 RepID=A0A6A6QEK1_9PEZI|nr:kinase-like protein [Lophium mytilinum]